MGAGEIMAAGCLLLKPIFQKLEDKRVYETDYMW
jgi:hypothetical protein